MKMKNLFISAIVLAALIVIIAIVSGFQHKKSSEKPASFFPEFSASSCSAILMIEKTDTARVVRKGPSWFVAGRIDYPADSAAIVKALGKLKTMTKDELLSRNPEKQADLQVDSATGLYVEAWDEKGASLGAVYIGKCGANNDSYFVRQKGNSDVYLVFDNDVRFSFFANVKRWRDKSIIKFDLSDVKVLTIARKDSAAIKIVKVNDSANDASAREEWNIIEPVKGKAKKDKVIDLLNKMLHLAAADFEGDTTLSAEKMGFTKPELSLSVTLGSGRARSLIVGGKKVAMNWIKNPDIGKTVFTVYEYDVNYLLDAAQYGALKE
jgi:hypothetical protein